MVPLELLIQIAACGETLDMVSGNAEVNGGPAHSVQSFSGELTLSSGRKMASPSPR
jgi:hypothetical protein